jgi:hypothetical protein
MSLADRVKSSGAKILVVDMERLVGLARVWDQKTNFVPATNFVRLPMTLCFAAKWYGSKTTEFHAAWDGGFDAMVQRSWEMYDEANIVVTYNGRRFDNLHFRRRLAQGRTHAAVARGKTSTSTSRTASATPRAA